MLCAVLFTLLLNSSGLLATRTIVLKPTKSGPPVGLIVLPGAYISGDAYVPLCDALQDISSFSLYVGLTTDYAFDAPTNWQGFQAIDDALKDLKDAGLDRSAPIFLAGHSQGGVVMQAYMYTNKEKITAGILWASYLTGNYENLAAFPLPIMHLSGSIDGQVRITDIATRFEQLSNLLPTDPSAIFFKPIIILPKINHGQFASGNLPPNVANEDIPPEIPAGDAYALIAEYTEAYLQTIAGSNQEMESARDKIGGAVNDTAYFLKPIFGAKALEISDNGKSSPWIDVAQEKVANVPEDFKEKVVYQHVLYDNHLKFEFSKPSVVTQASGIVLVTERGFVTYSSEQSADEIEVKMKSQAAVKKVLGGSSYGDTVDCKALNEDAFATAYSLATDDVIELYERRGRHMTFGADKIVFTGLAWTDSPLKYVDQEIGNRKVTSTRLQVPTDFIIPSLAGAQYCKLLSPYKALEWIYVDSLKPLNPNGY